MRQTQSRATSLLSITGMIFALGSSPFTGGCKREDAAAATATRSAEPPCTGEELEKAKRMPKENDVMTAPIKPSDVPECGVSFYDVSLVCRAAPKIGCGSRAKPVLQALMQSSHVAGAWLNEAGTQLAIAWRRDSTPLTPDELTAVGGAHGLKLDAVADPARNGLLGTFRTNAGWYDATTVDRLSEQEAGVIAARLVNRFAAKSSVPDDVKARLRSKVERVLRSYITSGRALAARDDSTRIREVREEIIAATRSELSEAQVSALEQVVMLGYLPLANEE